MVKVTPEIGALCMAARTPLGPAPLGETDLLIAVEDLEIALGLIVHVANQFLRLTLVVYGFDGLLKADGDKQADADGADVDQEVFPRVGGFVGWMDV